MRHLDLFSGIGGFALAASRTLPNHELVAFCEINATCRRTLRAHWPGIKIINDIHNVTKEKIHRQVDLVTGGFPCQPFSVAGAREGGDDSRFLWPQMARVISWTQPTWIVCENVTGLLSMDNERNQVLSDLDNEGYDVDLLIIPAAATGAWHQRDRVWIVAYTNDERRREQCRTGPVRKKQLAPKRSSGRPSWNNGLEPIPWPVSVRRRGEHRRIKRELCRMADGIPYWLDTTNRNERLRALGNSICVPVAEEIFKTIKRINE